MKEIIAVYPYRDSDETKITPGTKTIHIVSCGVPKIEKETVIQAYDLASGYLKEFNSEG